MNISIARDITIEPAIFEVFSSLLPQECVILAEEIILDYVVNIGTNLTFEEYDDAGYNSVLYGRDEDGNEVTLGLI